MPQTKTFFKAGPFDALLCAADQALRTLWSSPHARRPMPEPAQPPQTMGDDDDRNNVEELRDDSETLGQRAVE